LCGTAVGGVGILLGMSLLQTEPVKPSIAPDPEAEVAAGAPEYRAFEPHRFTVEEYDALSELNLPPGKTELVHGVIIHMPGAGNGHAVALQNLYDLLRVIFPRPWFLRTQSTHRMGKYLAREPDIALLTKEPVIGAKLDEVPKLVVEISHKTLANDLGPKRLDYGQHGVPEYWVVDIRGKVVHVFRSPVTGATEAEGAYGSHQIFDAIGTLSPLGAPQGQIKIADFMPQAAID
jgi:Uma2 family endonuclease